MPEKIGIEPDTVGGHSLRAGFRTEAARNKASLAKMQEVSRQKKVEVLLGYAAIGRIVRRSRWRRVPLTHGCASTMALELSS
jgi:hypothetical protein